MSSFRSRPRVITLFDRGRDRTKQAFKDECDVNLIVARISKGENIEGLNKARGVYIDATNLPVSFHDALNMVNTAHEAFRLLPARVRDSYGNDVQSFLEAAYKDPEKVFSALNPALQPGSSVPATPVAPSSSETPPELPVAPPVDPA